MSAEIQFIYVNNTKLECLHIDIGAPKKSPKLVFLHEGLGCVALWRDFPKNLCKAAGLNGFVYSRQGYGASDPVSLPRPTDFMHNEAFNVVSPVLDAANIANAILIGHSDGGSISLIYAGSNKTKRIKSVITIAAHVFNEDLTIKSIEEAKVLFMTTNLRTRLAKYHGNNVDCAFWGWNNVWLDPGFRQWNIENFLSNISVPTLSIQGTDDQYGTQAQINAIKNGLFCINKTVMIKEAQHAPHIEQQKTTIAVISDFLKKNLDLR
jgi:pimeloyl-ACP methyl ester carboxylesterase